MMRIPDNYGNLLTVDRGMVVLYLRKEAEEAMRKEQTYTGRYLGTIHAGVLYAQRDEVRHRMRKHDAYGFHKKLLELARVMELFSLVELTVIDDKTRKPKMRGSMTVVDMLAEPQLVDRYSGFEQQIFIKVNRWKVNPATSRHE